MLLVRVTGDSIQFQAGRQTQLPLENSRTLDRVLQPRDTPQLVVSEHQLSGLVDRNPWLYRLVGHQQIKSWTEILVRPTAGTPDRCKHLGRLDSHQTTRRSNVEREIRAVSQHDLATLANGVQGMDAVDRHPRIVDRRLLDPASVHSRHREDFAHRRSRTLGVHLENKLPTYTTNELDSHHLTLLLGHRNPLADLGRRRCDVQDLMTQWHRDPQFGQLATQNLVVKKYVGMNQAVTDRDVLVVRYTRQQIHVRLLANTRIPQCGDLRSRTQAGTHPRATLGRFDRQCHQSRRQVDGLLGTRHTQFERRHPHGRTVQLERMTLGRSANPSRQFERHRMDPRLGEQQRVTTRTSPAKQNLRRLAIQGRRHPADRSLAELDRNLRPTLAQHLDTQRRRDPSQTLVHRRHVIRLSDHALDRRTLRNPVRDCSTLPQSQVLAVRKEHRRWMLVENRLQVPVRNVNPLLKFLRRI